MKHLREKLLSYADDLDRARGAVDPASVAWYLRALAGVACSFPMCASPPEDGYSTCERHTSEAYLRQYG